MKTLCQQFRQSAGRYPERIAVHHRGEDVTYAQLWDRAVAVADWLEESGLKRGERVGLLMPNSADYVACYLGILLSGGIAVALNSNTTPRELLRTLGNCEPAAVIVSSAAEKPLAECAAALASIRIVIRETQASGSVLPQDWRSALLADVCERKSAGPDFEGIDIDDVAQIIYTSGTSGHPKGVTLTHRNLAANCRSIVDYLKLTERDSVFVILPFFYSYGNSLLFTHVAVGGRLILAADFVYWNRALDLMERQRATGFAGVPSSYAMLLHKSDFARRSFPHLRYVTCAGGALPAQHVERIRKRLPHVSLYLMYGQTEATARLSTLLPDELAARPGSIGRGIPGVRLRVVDGEGRPVAAGETGELVAEGDNVMTGYWNDPEQTADVLRPEGLRTGDLARCDEDGYFYLVGRKSDMIKYGAHRIHPGELEEVILELPGVAEVAVAGVPDEILGELPVAFVVRTSDAASLTRDAVLRHCEANLPRHKAVRAVRMVDQLPKTPSGKVRRGELVRRWHPDE